MKASRLALVAAVAMTIVGAQAVGAGQGTSQAELRKPFIGTWKLVSITGGANPANRGQMPTGVIMYDADGYMNVQIAPDRPRPTYTGAPTAEQALEAIRGYTAYLGTYTIDEKANTVTHHREGMLDAGVVDYVRRFEMSADGNRVTLIPVGGAGPETRLTWERRR